MTRQELIDALQIGIEARKQTLAELKKCEEICVKLNHNHDLFRVFTSPQGQV
ncbi:MAG: hypothetical protein ACRCZZ_04730 [Phocaeicola sp.]